MTDYIIIWLHGFLTVVKQNKHIAKTTYDGLYIWLHGFLTVVKQNKQSLTHSYR